MGAAGAANLNFLMGPESVCTYVNVLLLFSVLAHPKEFDCISADPMHVSKRSFGSLSVL